MLGNAPAGSTRFHRSSAVTATQNSSHSIDINPPAPTQLNRSTLWGKGNFGASPALKTLGASLLPVGVATIGFGGLGILIIVVGVTMWVSSTMTSAHESVRPKGQSFSAHIAESIGWALLGIPLIIGTCLKSCFGSSASAINGAPAPKVLNRFTACCKKIIASPIMKNIAAVLTGAGTGAALGCPWLVTLLIGVGVGTSWAGGIGVAIAAVGVVLWIISTHWSMQEKPQQQDAAAHIAESAGMAVIGLPCAIIGGCSKAYQWCRSSNDETVTPDSDLQDHSPASGSTVGQHDLSSIQERRVFVSDPSLDE